MADTNYIGCIVKILETPKQKIEKNNRIKAQFRVQVPQSRNQSTTIARVTFWANLARDINEYYKVGDYIIIEGYISVSKSRKRNKVKITAFKVYPFLIKRIKLSDIL